MFRTFSLICILSFGMLLPTASAAVLFLKDGGTVEGEVLNPDEISRKTYRIRTTDGLEITLDARLVDREQRRERDALLEYNAKAPFTDNTVENHHFWAKWCGEQQLPDQAKVHWQQILELDPDHRDTRIVLGYTKDKTGDWVSSQDRLGNKGYVQDKGRWRTQYQIEVENILDNREKEARYWRDTIRDLSRKLPQSEADLLTIRDPAAFAALRDALLAETNPRYQVILLRTLVRLPYDGAFQFVVGWSLRTEETSEDVRQVSIEEVQKRIREFPEARRSMIAVYRDSLRPTTHPEIIGLAAKVLGDIGGVEAVPELIEVLVQVRTEVIQTPQQGQSFGSGGSGINWGAQPPKTITTPLPNQAVLSALQKLTRVNFGFNQAAWRDWYRQTQRVPTFNLRRD